MLWIVLYTVDRAIDWLRSGQRRWLYLLCPLSIMQITVSHHCGQCRPLSVAASTIDNADSCNFWTQY